MKFVYSKVREETLSQGVDFSINLAHVHLSLGRYPDADHIYQSTLKLLLHSNNVDRMASICEWTGMAQLSYQRHVDAACSLSRSIHYNPLGLRYWYDIAVIYRDLASLKLKKHSPSVDDMQYALSCVEYAQHIFSFLTKSSYVASLPKRDYDRTKTDQFSKNCKVNFDDNKLEEDISSSFITF